MLQCADDIQVQLEHRAVVVGDVSAQRLAQLGGLLARVALGQRGEPHRVVLAGNDGLEHGAAAVSEDIREHAAQFEVGVFEDFLDAQAVLGDLAHELLAGAREIAQLLGGGRWHEARSDQAVGEQIGNPHRVVDVGLAAGHVADVLGVGQHQLEVALEDVPHRLPVHAGGFHGHVGAAVQRQPVGQRQQAGGGAVETAHFVMHGRGDAAHTGHDGVLVHVQPGTAGIEHLHGASCQSQWQRQQPSSSKSTRRALECCHPWSQFGVLAGLRVQLLNGLGAPSTSRPRCRYQTPSYAHPIAMHGPQARFILRGRARPMNNY
ncbi:hypothetical protein D9M68_684910 [compost metagenome]